MADEVYWPIGDIIMGAHDVSPTAEVLPFLLGACIVLNCPLISHDILASLFARFQSRICADGGSNLIYDSFPSVRLEPGISPYMPDSIVGDLDSLRPEVRKFFEDHGTVIHQEADQDSTDLDKSLRYYASKLTDDVDRFVAIIGTIGSHEGRIDQFFAVINSMYSWRQSRLRVFSVGNESVLIVLKPGSHRIQVPPSALNRHCGMVPMFGKVEKVSTSGFEWNLSNEPTEFGGLVPTNNIIRDEFVTIETSDPLVFSFTYS